MMLSLVKERWRLVSSADPKDPAEQRQLLPAVVRKQAATDWSRLERVIDWAEQGRQRSVMRWGWL